MTTTAKYNPRKTMKTNRAVLRLLALANLVAIGAVHAATTYTWVGAGGDNVLQNTNNWTPLTVALPSSSANDTLLWNGSQAGNLLITNRAGGTFDANPGFYMNITAAQVGSIQLVESNGFTGRIRLNGTNTFNMASGAGAFTFGNGGTVGLPIALAGRGNGEVHNFTNNSANPVTFNTDCYWVMGGGGSHTLLLAGTGDFNLNVTIQPNNAAGLALTVAGPGAVNYVGAPPTGAGITTPGTYGQVTLSGGVLRLGAPNALGIGNTLVINGGSLDSSVVDLVNANNNLQTWAGNFSFVGTQNLDLGFGPVTINGGGNRVVTVNAKTLTVQGAISGNNATLVKAGAGTLVVNGFNTYNGGTTVSNGVLKIAQPLPAGTFNSERIAVHGGTFDLNGQSITASSFNGTGGAIDTTSATPVTLTIGNFDGTGTFNGSINNTAGSIALIKNGVNTITLGGASTYNGGTTINAGTLLLSNTTGSGTGSGAVTVGAGATFGGSGIATGPVTWQSGATASFIQGSPLTVNGSITLNANPITINVPGSIPLGAGTYTLMTYTAAGSTGTFQSTANFTGAGVSAGSSVSVTTGGGLVLLIVAAPPGLSATWTNLGSGNWSVGANWSSNPQIPQKAGEVATLGLGNAFTTVTLDLPVTNGFVSFNNTNSFTIANAGNTLTFDNTNGGSALVVVSGSSNSIAAPVSLNDRLAVAVFPNAAVTVSGSISGTSPSHTLDISSGSGTLTLAGNNSYGPAAGSVGTTISGSGSSTLILANNNALSTGDVSMSRNSTIRAGGALTVANNLIISNTVTTSFDDNANAVTLSGTISGGGAFAKSGSGTVTLSSANSYTGDTSISGGTVKLANAAAIPGGPGNGNVNMGTNTVLDLNGFSPVLNGLNNAAPGGAVVDSTTGAAVTLTLGQNDAFATFYGNIRNTSGSLALVKEGVGNQTLAGTNTYTGGTTINAGLLRVGNGNTNALAGLGTGPVFNNGTLEFNLWGTNTFTNTISGSGALNVANVSERLNLYGNNTFTGPVNVNQGALWITNAGALGVGPKTVTVTGGGNSLLTELHLNGVAGNINIDSSISFFLSYLNGVLFNEAGTNTIAGNISLPFGGGNAYVIARGGFLTLAGNVASDGVASGRTLQLGGSGNGLFSGSAYDNVVGLGSVTKTDAGTWTLSGVSTTTGQLNANAGTLRLTGQWGGGPAVVNSGGTLVGTGSATNLTVNTGGRFVPGDFGSIGTFTVTNNFVWSGATYVSLNKSLAQSNSFVNIVNTGATNAVANTGSTLVISNLGPALVAGDKFVLFNQPVTNGNLVALTLPPLASGLAISNNLAVDGSLLVVNPVATNPTNITSTLVGNQLILSWPLDHKGWKLQSQTNALTTGLSNNWFTINGSETNNSYTNIINPLNGSVFYRLTYP